MLNYLLSLLFAETKLKLLQAGLNPVGGIFHADDKFRESLVCDVMEAGRYPVEEWLIKYIMGNKLPKDYFYEEPNGVVRLTLKLSPMFCETIEKWSMVIDPAVKRVKRMLAR